MNKKLVLLMAVVFALSMLLVGCGDSEAAKEKEAAESARQERLTAVEDQYKISEKSADIAGVTVTYPQLSNMVNLTKQRNLNGRITIYGEKVDTDRNGNSEVVSKSYKVLAQNADVFSVVFPTTIDADIEDQAITYLFANDKIIYRVFNLVGKDDPGFGDFTSTFDSYRTEQGAPEVGDITNAIIALEGDDSTNLTLHVIYFADGESQDVTLPLNDVYSTLKDDMKEMMSFTQGE